MKKLLPLHYGLMAIATLVLYVVLDNLKLPTVEASDSRPNIVYVMADDMGYGDFSPTKTPKLYNLMQTKGTRFSMQSMQNCVPTRSAFFTGSEPSKINMHHIDTVDRYKGIPTTTTMVSEHLKAAGYYNGAFGKWHLGHATVAQLPLQRGFDKFTGFFSGNINYYGPNPFFVKYQDNSYGHDAQLSHHMLHGNTPLFTTQYATNLFTDAAVDFVKNAPVDKPFFAYVAYNTPHGPLSAPKNYVNEIAIQHNLSADDMSKLIEFSDGTLGIGRFVSTTDPVQVDRINTVVYLAALRAMDDGVEKIYNELERRGVANNTIFIFTSDNGAEVRQGVGSNAPFRAGKGSAYEGGHNVPSFIVWPAKIAVGQNINQQIWVGDMFNTFLRVAGVQPVKGIESTDMYEQLTTGTTTNRANGGNHIVTNVVKAAKGNAYWGTFALNMGGQVKYIKNFTFDSSENIAGTSEEFYDLRTDVAEQVNLATNTRYAALLQRARTKYNNFGGDTYMRNLATNTEAATPYFSYPFPVVWWSPQTKTISEVATATSILKTDALFRPEPQIPTITNVTSQVVGTTTRLTITGTNFKPVGNGVLFTNDQGGRFVRYMDSANGTTITIDQPFIGTNRTLKSITVGTGMNAVSNAYSTVPKAPVVNSIIDTRTRIGNSLSIIGENFSALNNTVRFYYSQNTQIFYTVTASSTDNQTKINLIVPNVATSGRYLLKVVTGPGLASPNKAVDIVQ